MELSINFLVTMVISITLLIFGIRFIYKLQQESTSLRDITFEELDRSIGELLCENQDIVCIGLERKVIPKGKFDKFGVKVINVKDSQEFYFDFNENSPKGFNKNKQPITTSNIEFKHRNKAFINRNEEKTIGIAINVPKNTQSGTYIFNLVICHNDNDPATSDLMCSNSEFPDSYYKLQKLYVEVP